ncbi:uncharacterized protein CXorf65 homolog [Tubulanus polymorphus]|uniref:uncharacterized protein CXorf65 homolog n=1 Tax=Tubulanus polymorphus TaxID=672921 RepID=UPI003DA224A6
MATATAAMAAATAAAMNTINEEEDKGPTFVTVLFGDNQRAIFNPRCKVDIFMEHIRRKCCLREKTGTIDLVDLEGEIKNLSNSRTRDHLRYASDHINSRQCYVLVKVEKQSDRDPVRYTPLLQNLDEINPELFEKLNSLQVRQQGPTTPRMGRKEPNKTTPHKRNNSLKSGAKTRLDERRNSRK